MTDGEKPALPGYGLFLWMFWREPFRLQLVLITTGIDPDIGWRDLLKKKDPAHRNFLRRMIYVWVVGLVMVAVAFIILEYINSTTGVQDIYWEGVALGVAGAVALGVVGCVSLGVSLGVAHAVAGGVAGAVALGVGGAIAGGVTFGVAGAVAGAVAGGVAGGILVAFMVGLSIVGALGVTGAVTLGVTFGVTFGVPLGAAGGVALIVAGSVPNGVAGGVAGAIAFFGAWLVISPWVPFYMVELQLSLDSQCFTGINPTGLNQVPMRFQDLFYFPLPGFTSLAVRVGRHHPEVAAGLIAESTSLGLVRPARLALEQLRCNYLGRAGVDRAYHKVVVGDVPFFQTADFEEEPWSYVHAAARDLHAASQQGIHSQRRQMLGRAARALDAAEGRLFSYAFTHKALLRETLAVWHGACDDAFADLALDEAARPQVPVPFQSGQALKPTDAHLFRGRERQVAAIDQHLTGSQREPLLLWGQRRMGKSSLINLLPDKLGTGTVVVPVNFQKLSGDPERGANPAYWLACLVADTLGLTHRPEEKHWDAVLTWLAELERGPVLGDRRLLVCVDELESLETAIREGRADTAFLDFLRACGDRLTRTRFLLATAWPLEALGPHWVDKLITARQLRLAYLTDDVCLALIRKPTPDFPDIYPPGGAERIAAHTYGHPYLTQLVCDNLARHLNLEGRLLATDDDIDRACDTSLTDTPLFPELWRQLTEAERAVCLAVCGDDPPGPSETVTNLVERLVLTRRDGRLTMAVPLFHDWIVYKHLGK